MGVGVAAREAGFKRQANETVSRDWEGLEVLDAGVPELSGASKVPSEPAPSDAGVRRDGDEAGVEG